VQILVLIGLYFLKCTKFDQLVLRIIKIVATRCQILTLKCTKINFGWGSTPDPAGEAYSAPPDPLAGFKGPTSKGRGGERMGGDGALDVSASSFSQSCDTCQSCADQFLHFKDDVTCVLLVADILTFLMSDVPRTENGRLPTLAHLLGTHYLTRYFTQPFNFSI